MKAPPPGLSLGACGVPSHAGSLPPLKPAAARRRKMDQQCGNLRALWGGLIGVLVLAAGC